MKFFFPSHSQMKPLLTCEIIPITRSNKYTLQSKRKTQNPWSLQGQNQQFADRRDDSTWLMIVDKFYHFHHHIGITLIADPSWCPHNEQMYKVSWSYKVCLKNKCKCGHFYCMLDLIRNYAYLWSDKVVKKGHILSLISSAVLSYLILHKVS